MTLMLNSKPNNSKYQQGNFIPKYKDKIVKLNNQGGVYYRSSWELKIMTWLDNNKSITKWGAECMRIPYQLTEFKNGDVIVKEHSYFPDFYYELKTTKDDIKRVVVEVKPYKEYKMVQDLSEGKLTVPENGMKKLKNFEYDLILANKNKSKWETMIQWCNKKGYEFIIITEQHLKKFNI